MSDTHGPDEEIKLDTNSIGSEPGDLVKELENLISHVRNNCFNEEELKKAHFNLFVFNIGLLCGLKQGRK